VTRPRKPRSRRWLRLVVPYLVVVVLLVITGIAYAIEEPDVTDPTFLAPTSTAALGGGRLADRLAANGTRVLVVKNSPAALTAADAGDATLFIPAPNLVHPYYLRMLKLLPKSTQVVLVRPSELTSSRGYLPFRAAGERWTATDGAPACALPAAVAAGRAETVRGHYVGNDDPANELCYGSSVLRTRYQDATVTVVGATEPFRNDHIGRLGNAALAVGLLSGAARVIWLDLHHNEPPPTYRDDPTLDPAPSPAQLGSAGSPDPDFPVPDPNGTEGGDPQIGLPHNGQDDSGAGGPSLFSLFPDSAWTVLAL
jgi:hypothetical protein